jgi:hypothetical protein
MSTTTTTPVNGQHAAADAAPEQPKAPDRPIAVQQPQRLISQDDTVIVLDTARWEQMQRIARAMCLASLMPDHLRGKSVEEGQANCLLVVNQALRWGMDPFAVAPCTYSVRGKLGFEGKLVAAVVNARAGLRTKLAPVYNAKSGDGFAAVIYGSREAIPGEAYELLRKYAEEEHRASLNRLAELGVMAVRVSVAQSKTDNQMWGKDPEQKLFYCGATKWARRHCPELMLGVLTDDDLERMAADAVAAEALPQGRVNHRTPRHEPEPARQPGKEALGEATSHAPAPAQESQQALSEDDELRRQELIDHVKEQLGQDLTAKALEDVGGLILKNAALLGDATPHLSKLYADKKQAMSHGEPPANGGRRSRF